MTEGEVRLTNWLNVMQSYHDPLDEPMAETLDPTFFDFDYGKPLGKEELKGARWWEEVWRGCLLMLFVCLLCSADLRRGDA